MERHQTSQARRRHGWTREGGPGGDRITPSPKLQLLEQLEGKLGEHHSGEMRRESAQAKAERLIALELTRLKWSEAELARRRKSDPAKLALAARLPRETTLTIRQLAQRLHLGSWRSLNNKLYLLRKKKK